MAILLATFFIVILDIIRKKEGKFLLYLKIIKNSKGIYKYFVFK